MPYMVYYLCHVGPHCIAYYSNCAVIGHSTCQTATSLGRTGCRIVTRPFLSGRVGSGHETTLCLEIKTEVNRLRRAVYTQRVVPISVLV